MILLKSPSLSSLYATIILVSRSHTNQKKSSELKQCENASVTELDHCKFTWSIDVEKRLSNPHDSEDDIILTTIILC